MKLLNTILAGILLATSISSYANVSSLFVRHGDSLVNVESLVKNESDVQVDSGYENFCYKGNSSVVVRKMNAWKKTGYFFSGGGGGFVLNKLKINRGIYTYDIVMNLEDEVVQGEFKEAKTNKRLFLS